METRSEAMQIQELNVYAVVLYKNKFLIMKGTHGFWEFPGGGVDFGEHPLTSAHRELKEETGLEAKNLSLVGITSAIFKKQGNDKHAVYAIYKGTVTSDKVILSHEHTEYKWVTKSELSVFTLGLNAQSALQFL